MQREEHGEPHPAATNLDEEDCAVASDDLIDQTIALFEPRYGRKITREEAREILANLTGFFEILLEWDLEPKAKTSQAATVTSSDAPDEG